MKTADGWRPSRGFIYSVIGMLIFLGLGFVGPISGGIKYAKHNAAMQQTRMIGQCMFNYATDNVKNGNAYPDGKSSTEVFQKLIDAKYVEDPTIFYLPLPGKVKALPGQKLKPENVCWDVTAGVDSKSSDDIPLVFMTGYKMTYGSKLFAVPVIKPYPPFWSERTWSEWWHGTAPPPDKGPPGMAIFYKGNNCCYFRSSPDYSVQAAPRDFSDSTSITVTATDAYISTGTSSEATGISDGKTYRQLTPEGELK